MAQLVTYILIGYLIEAVSKSTFFWIMTVIIFSGSMVFLFIKTPSKTSDELTGVELAQVGSEDVQVEGQAPSSGPNEAPEKIDEQPKQESVMATIKFIGTPKMLQLLPMCSLHGFMVATMSSVYINFWIYSMKETERFIYTEDQYVEQAVWILLTFAIGNIAGGIIIGALVDKYGHKSGLATLLVVVVTANLLILW